jgi:hypothetical protein
MDGADVSREEIWVLRRRPDGVKKMRRDTPAGAIVEDVRVAHLLSTWPPSAL